MSDEMQSRTRCDEARADCPTCGELAPGELNYVSSDRARAALRRWARRHAQANPGHRTHVETTTIRTYEVSS